MLRQLQNDFYEHIVPFGVLHGAEFTKYTSLQQQSKTYNERVDHRIDAINTMAKEAQQEIIALKQQLAQTQHVLASYELQLEEKIKLKKQQEAALQRQIELNERKLREKEELDKEQQKRNEATQRMKQVKKINNAKGKGKDKGEDNEQGYGGHSMW